MLQIPKILDTPDFYDAPLNYKWSEDLFYEWEYELDDEKLNKLFLQLNHKAALGMAAALAEWIFWRLHRKADFTGILLTIEPLWAGLIDKRYIVGWNYANKGETDHIFGVKRLTLGYIQHIRICYRRGLYDINGYMDSLTLLARHISPDHDFFDTWFNNCATRALKLFPVPYDYRKPAAYDTNGKPYHDSTTEPPIPREFFFEPGFAYNKADIPNLLNNFLSTLSCEENDLLNPPEKMLEEGFQGTPYQYQPK